MNRKLAQLSRKLTPIADERAITPQDLKLLAEPTREFIFNALVHEPRTATELGHLLGCPTTRLYHHLKLLEKHGLIMVVSQRLVSGIVERRYRAVAQRLRLDRSVFGAELPGNQQLEAVLNYVFDQARSDVTRSHAAGLIDLAVQPPAREALMAYRHVLKLSAPDRDRLIAQLHRLYEEYESLSQDSLPDDGEFVSLVLAAYPTELRAGDQPQARGARSASARRGGR